MKLSVLDCMCGDCVCEVSGNVASGCEVSGNVASGCEVSVNATVLKYNLCHSTGKNHHLFSSLRKLH